MRSFRAFLGPFQNLNMVLVVIDPCLQVREFSALKFDDIRKKTNNLRRQLAAEREVLPVAGESKGPETKAFELPV